MVKSLEKNRLNTKLRIIEKNESVLVCSMDAGHLIWQ